MNKKVQISESIELGILLALSGGFMDAYSYMCRGKVFANAQTGNIVLLSQHIFAGDFGSTLHYLIPVVFFAFGVAAAELIRQKYQKTECIHWRQLVLILEILLLFLVGFLPDQFNLIANALVSFSCAMQVQAFRKVNSFAFASTMCIGNIRSGMESLCAYHKTHNRDTLYKASHYFGVIFLFALGAGLGSCFIPLWGLKTIWASCLLLMVSFLLMFIREEIEEHPEILEEEKAIQNDLHDLHKEAKEIARTLREDH